MSGVAGAASSAFLQPTNARQTANTNKESTFIFDLLIIFLPAVPQQRSLSERNLLKVPRLPSTI